MWLGPSVSHLRGLSGRALESPSESSFSSDRQTHQGCRTHRTAEQRQRRTAHPRADAADRSEIHLLTLRVSQVRDDRCIHNQEPVTGLTHGFYKYPARFSSLFTKAAIEAFTELATSYTTRLWAVVRPSSRRPCSDGGQIELGCSTAVSKLLNDCCKLSVGNSRSAPASADFAAFIDAQRMGRFRTSR